MILSSFRVKNFRSIVDANFPLSKVTVLLGKNNEGKSNILRAFTIAMRVLESHSEVRTSKRIMLNSQNYRWERDYPKNLQVGGKKKRADRVTTFILVFKLDIDEIDSFRKEIGNSLNGELPIEIKIGPSDMPSIKVVKKGKGSKSLNAKSKKIATYISKLISYNAIPAVRTEDDCLRVVDNLVRRELDKLEELKEYKDALQVIEDIRKPIIDEISLNIKNVLVDFLPSIKSVTVKAYDRRYNRVRPYESSISIDDGQDTELEDKGDGVKSLVTLGLLQNQWIKGGASVVAIEEPESHLHPEAINRLRETIYALAKTNQVVITTHNPLFVNRENIGSNIIVDKGKAKIATNVRSIRTVLGVKISDNLFDAKLAILVEGVADERSLKAILSERSAIIKKAIDEHLLVFIPLRGVKNLGYYANMFRSLVASFYCILDGDAPALQEVKNLLTSKVLLPNEYNCILIPGHKNGTELEDTYDASIYSKFLQDEYGVNVLHPVFGRKDKKWADKLQDLFVTNGSLFDKDTEETIKNKIADIVEAKSGEGVVMADAEPLFTNIIGNIEKHLKLGK